MTNKKTHKSKDKQIALYNLRQRRDTVFKQFPLTFALLGTFGLVSTYYGFQHIIERIPLLANNPEITLGVGVLVLAATGTLYKKLG